jgi:hypothetical protein
MLSASFQVLHFRVFLEQNGPLPAVLLQHMAELKSNPSPDLIQQIESSDEYHDITKKYSDFTENTLNGVHGNTARYWMMYCSLVALYL